jgi:hypothetical protein
MFDFTNIAANVKKLLLDPNTGMQNSTSNGW